METGCVFMTLHCQVAKAIMRKYLKLPNCGRGPTTAMGSPGLTDTFAEAPALCNPAALGGTHSVI